MNAPRLFISYSWSNANHEQWVEDLAHELVQSGIDVLFDKWELREGNDTIAFMERVVSDQSISKVVLICDEEYAKKADERTGGVGTETQIISAEVYAKQNQSKFVAVIAKKDENGRPCLPVYYKSRIFIDLSDGDRYAENFEKLVRWVFDKPLAKKPEIGKPPSYITDSSVASLSTTHLAKRALDAIRGDKGFAKGALDEYLTAFVDQLEGFRLVRSKAEFDELVIQSIEDFLSARNEFIQVLSTLARYSEIDNFAVRLHRFYESLIPFTNQPPHVDRWNDTDFDNFRFIVGELFLYGVAILLREAHFGVANVLLEQPYYVGSNLDHGQSPIVTFSALWKPVKTLDDRDERLKLRKISPVADLLRQRVNSSGLSFPHLMQADLVCFLRYQMKGNNSYPKWWPDTLVYAERQPGPFEIFARSSSKAHLLPVLNLVGADSLAEFKARIARFELGDGLPKWGCHTFNPATLVGLEHLGSRP